MYHGNDSERNIPAAVLKKLLDVCSSIYPYVLLVAMHTYGCGEVLISEE